jgi:CelD/BcsL family acetyltransferase involved in cellulose biosynthesis
VTSVALCEPDELGPAELARWRGFQRCDARLGNPFLAPEFAVAVGRHRRDVRVAVLEDGPAIVGFFPYHRRPMGVGRALGYGLSNAQGFVHTAGLEWNAKDLLAKCGLSVWEFDNLVAHQLPAFGGSRAQTAAAPFIDPTRGWDDWLAAKRAASKTIKGVQQKHRKLGREMGELSFEFDSARRDGLDLLMRWKSHQYLRTGRVDRFAQRWFAAVFEELTQLSTVDFAGILSVLCLGGQPIAIEQGLSANGVLACWFPAYDTCLARYSPGYICWLEIVRAAGERGLREVNLGRGEAEYKEILKDGAHTMACGWVERATPVATLRRLQQAPRRHTLDFVHARPRLRLVARRALRGVGRLRTALRRG